MIGFGEKAEVKIPHTAAQGYLFVQEAGKPVLDAHGIFNLHHTGEEGSIQEQLDRAKRRRNVTIVSCRALGVTAGILEYINLKTYENYESATISSKAEALYGTANLVHHLSGYVAIAAGLSAVPILSPYKSTTQPGKYSLDPSDLDT